MTKALALAALLSSPAAAQMRPVSAWPARPPAGQGAAIRARMNEAFARRDITIYGAQLLAVSNDDDFPGLVPVAEALASLGVADAARATPAQLTEALALTQTAISAEVDAMVGVSPSEKERDDESYWQGRAERGAAFAARFPGAIDYAQSMRLRDFVGVMTMAARSARVKRQAEDDAAALAQDKPSESAPRSGGGDVGNTLGKPGAPVPSFMDEPPAPALSKPGNAVVTGATYLGGALGLFGLALFMGWAAMTAGTGAAVGVSVVYLAAFYAAAAKLKASGKAEPAGVAATLAVAMVPVAIATAMIAGEASFDSFGQRAIVEIAAIPAAILAARRFPSHLIALPAMLAYLALGAEAASALYPGDLNSGRTLFTSVGVFALAFSRGLERNSAVDYARWSYLLGAAALVFGAGAFMSPLVFGLVGLALILGGSALNRHSLALAGAYPVLAYLFHIVPSFDNLLVASVSVIAAGIGIPAAAYAYFKKHAALGAWVRGLLKRKP